jgi:prepilin-type N-terminal cleavage/methylation domain-containing protein
MMVKKGFTLVELLAVILIAGILALVATPILRGRIDSAKWSEGKAIAGTIASALRIYCVEKGEEVGVPELGDLGFVESDLKGKYFNYKSYSWTVTYDDISKSHLYTVTIKRPEGISSPDRFILDQSGQWTAEND